MKKIAFLLFCVCLAMPASAAKKEVRPEWLSSPLKFCMLNELCVIGSGKTLNAAKADAHAEMLKIFENNVKSSFKNTLSSDGKEELKDLTSDEVSILSEGVISGVKVKQTHRGKEAFYVLASLNKTETAKTLKIEIEQRDDEMKALMKEGTPAAIQKVREILPYREALNRRYAFLNRGNGIKEPVSYSDVFEKKKLVTEGKVLFVSIAAEDNGKIEREVTKVFSELGYKISKGLHTSKVSGSLLAEEEFSNVKGFVRYAYTLVIQSDKDEAPLSVTIVTAGRDEKQAYNRALPQLIGFVKEHANELSL